MQRMFLIFIAVIIGINNFSCKTLYGIKVQKEIKESKINIFYERLRLTDCRKAIVDSTYSEYFKKKLTNDSLQLYYHLQPLQALYFDSENNLISFHVNCNTGGFPNLQWNRNGVFNVFPPKSQSKINNIVMLNELINVIGLKKLNESPNDYTVVIFWNLFLERQSKKLIETVIKNLKLTKKKVSLILINNDKLYMRIRG